MVRDQEHKWNHCKCVECGKTRDQHVWDGCTCSICKRTRGQGHQLTQLRDSMDTFQTSPWPPTRYADFGCSICKAPFTRCGLTFEEVEAQAKAAGFTNYRLHNGYLEVLLPEVEVTVEPHTSPEEAACLEQLRPILPRLGAIKVASLKALIPYRAYHKAYSYEVNDPDSNYYPRHYVSENIERGYMEYDALGTLVGKMRD
jgi:hypothetical protein